MRVLKRSGIFEEVNFEKIAKRIKKLSWNLDAVDSSVIVAQVASSLVDGLATESIDQLTAEIAIAKNIDHPDYGKLAARVAMSNIHKKTSENVLGTYEKMAGALNPDFLALAKKHSTALQEMIVYKRDYDFDFFGIKTLECMYCTKINGELVERPQHMYLRVALAVCGDDIPRVKETYDLLSKKFFTHASPTLFNAGMKVQQLASCFTGDMMICTVNRGAIPIREAAIGDIVVTHQGNIKPVSQLHINPLGDRIVYDVKVFKTPVLEVTGNHRMWSVVKNDMVPRWRSIDSLSEGDFIAMPTYGGGVSHDTWDIRGTVTERLDSGCSVEISHDTIIVRRDFCVPNHHNGFPVPVNRFWSIDENFAWFLGVWYGDGCVVHGGDQRRCKAINIVGATSNPNLLEKVFDVGRRTFGIKPTVYEHKGQDLTTITWNSNTIASAFKSMFGHGHLGKRLHPSMFSWNRQLVTAFLGGFVSVDGCVSKRGYCTATSTCFDMLQGIYHLCRQVGIDVSLAEVKKTKVKESHCDSWFMSIPWTLALQPWVLNDRLHTTAKDTFKHNMHQVEVDGVIFVKIVNKSVSSKQPTHVYTLGIEDDHSYNVQGLVCENCFLDGSDDSLDGIFDCFHRCARISKYGGGLGVNISTIRSKGAPIRSTNGHSDGVIPMLKVANSVTSYINQTGKRKGSMAVYIEPHHPDIFDFLNLRRPGGDEEMRCRDLFLAMWVSDEFMRRVEKGEKWSLLDPSLCPGLDDAYGDAFTELYKKYEAGGKASKVVEARDVWNAILTSQIESGVPYILNKDACNLKSNQRNVGTIKSSNLCVAPETLVLTNQGHQRIDELCNSSVDVWNGLEWSSVVVKKTSDRSELLRVTFSDGKSLECTPYHKFYIKNGVEVRASELAPRDVLLPWTDPDGNIHTSLVKSVEYTGRMDATYCFTEPKRHMGVFNEVLTGNCAEIVEYSSPGEEVAVCTLASIGLPAFVKQGVLDFDELHRVTKVVARNLDSIVDINRYPIEEARISNMRHRPLGIGIQGLADTFIKMRLSFDSSEALALNQRILATMYHAALEMSTELAAVHGPYPTFDGSPASQGFLQYDLWNETPVDGLDWDGLKQQIARHGLRNSLSLALMPTASTAQLLGNSEAAEPVTSLYYVRRTLAGEYACIHKYLLEELVSRGLWSPTIKNALIRDGGSIQHIYEIPKDIRELYKTSYDIKQRVIIDQAAARGPYVCQSQSMNLFVAAPTFAKLTAMHFHSWKAGLKTINYYLRSKPASRAAQVTLDSSSSSEAAEEEEVCVNCSG